MSLKSVMSMPLPGSSFHDLTAKGLFNMIVQCTAKQIDDFRGALWAMYRHAQKDDFDEAETQSMTLFEAF